MYKLDDIEFGNAYCLECGEPLYGRTDKKFCNSTCRNAWHGQIRSDRRQFRTHTIECLSRNYDILDGLLKTGRSSCPLDNLTGMGFKPEYITQRLASRGPAELRCFDIAYCQSSIKIYNIRRLF